MSTPDKSKPASSLSKGNEKDSATAEKDKKNKTSKPHGKENKSGNVSRHPTTEPNPEG